MSTWKRCGAMLDEQQVDEGNFGTETFVKCNEPIVGSNSND
jgi:hypothetical protein